MSSRQITAAPPAAPISAAVTTAQVFASLQSAILAAVLPVLGTTRLEAKKFVIRASGTVTTTGATTTFAPGIAVGGSTTPANNTPIAVAAGVTVNATSCPWYIEAQCIFDSTSGKLNGVFSSLVNNAFGATAPFSTVITGLNSKTEPVFSLVAQGTFSTASTGNVATLSEFVLET